MIDFRLNGDTLHVKIPELELTTVFKLFKDSPTINEDLFASLSKLYGKKKFDKKALLITCEKIVEDFTT